MLRNTHSWRAPFKQTLALLAHCSAPNGCPALNLPCTSSTQKACALVPSVFRPLQQRLHGSKNALTVCLPIFCKRGSCCTWFRASVKNTCALPQARFRPCPLQLLVPCLAIHPKHLPVPLKSQKIWPQWCGQYAQRQNKTPSMRRGFVLVQYCRNSGNKRFNFGHAVF